MQAAALIAIKCGTFYKVVRRIGSIFESMNINLNKIVF